MKLGASIAREMSGKKITDFDIIFPKKFANGKNFIFLVFFKIKKGDIAQFLNGLALANYKFDLKTYKKEETEEAEEENNGKDKKKGFHPIENINVLKEDFDLSGNFKQWKNFLNFKIDPYLQLKLKSAECTIFSRNLANTRANIATTDVFFESFILLNIWKIVYG